MVLTGPEQARLGGEIHLGVGRGGGRAMAPQKQEAT